MGCTIKLLGVAKDTPEGIEARVHPMLIDSNHPLATVNDSYNAVFLTGDAVQDTMFYGRGAGELPTASAVVGDIFDVVRNILWNCCGRIGCTCYRECPIKRVGEIGVISGRYYAMDRDNRWDRVELAYKALTKGEGVEGTDAAEAVQASYDAEKTDEFVLPTVLKKDGKPVATIQDKDSVVFFNFRPDRARELTRAFCADEFTGFEREKRLDLTYVCFTEYDETIPNKSVAFKKEEITNTFGEYLAAHNMTQARIAETEKYAHVTFFFNGGVEEPNKGEDRILVKSPKVATYDLKPEMSAYEVCDKLTDAIRSQKYDVIIINFANPDMVGHTGVESAAIQAVEAVDECVGKAVDALKEVDGQMFICADHGNAEQLVDYETGEPYTAHTTNPVPFILVNADPSYTLREGGCLADIAPTLIELMGMEQPKEMTGKSLLIKK